MACLDTSFLIDLLRGNPSVRGLKDELDLQEHRLCIAAPSIMELWTGACLKASEREKNQIKSLLTSLTILALDELSALKAGELESLLIKKGITISTEDVMIAAIALHHHEKVVTRDAHFTCIPGLQVLKY